jgi:hypothetical protein
VAPTQTAAQQPGTALSGSFGLLRQVEAGVLNGGCVEVVRGASADASSWNGVVGPAAAAVDRAPAAVSVWPWI